MCVCLCWCLLGTFRARGSCRPRACVSAIRVYLPPTGGKCLTRLCLHTLCEGDSSSPKDPTPYLGLSLLGRNLPTTDQGVAASPIERFSSEPLSDGTESETWEADSYIEGDDTDGTDGTDSYDGQDGNQPSTGTLKVRRPHKSPYMQRFCFQKVQPRVSSPRSNRRSCPLCVGPMVPYSIIGAYQGRNHGSLQMLQLVLPLVMCERCLRYIITSQRRLVTMGVVAVRFSSTPTGRLPSPTIGRAPQDTLIVVRAPAGEEGESRTSLAAPKNTRSPHNGSGDGGEPRLTTCPRCKQQLRVPLGAEKAGFRCGICNTGLYVPGSKAHSEALQRATQASQSSSSNKQQPKQKSAEKRRSAPNSASSGGPGNRPSESKNQGKGKDKDKNKGKNKGKGNARSRRQSVASQGSKGSKSTPKKGRAGNAKPDSFWIKTRKTP